MIRPILTEKSLSLAAKGWYTFAVDMASRKNDIAHEVGEAYKVAVTRVRTIRMPQKTRRVGRAARPTIRSAWKKALVTLSKGQTIDAFEVSSQQEGKK